MKKVFTLFILISLLSNVHAQTAHTINQNTSKCCGGGANGMGSSFLTLGGGDLKYITVYNRTTNQAQLNVTLSIYEGNGITGTQLHTETYTILSPVVNKTISLKISDKVTLQSNTTYTFYVVGMALRKTNSGNPYTNGSLWEAGNQSANGDLDFILHFETPEPTLSLSSNTVSENAALEHQIGTFSTTNASAPITYSFTTGTGATDNTSFDLDGNKLLLNNSLDFETKDSYSIRLQAIDNNGLAFEKNFTITVTNVNEAPTNITLSSTSIDENNSANAVVGTLSATDLDAGDTFTYALASGGTDNASFSILGNSLRITPITNFETKNSYSIKVKVTDAGGLTFEKDFTINVTNVNEAPTDIQLSNNSIAENVPLNTEVGILTATDPDAGNTFTYALAPGGTDNTYFIITGNSLKIASAVNYEVKNSYAIKIKVTDQGSLSFEKNFTISVTDVNEAPTNIQLSSNSIAENQAPNSLVGTLSATDPDNGNTFSYTLADGVTDNAAFSITGNSLNMISSANFEVKNSYAIRIKVSDQGNLSFEKNFTITITNVNEAPTDIQLNNNSIAENVPLNAQVGILTATDPDAGNTFTYALAPGGTDNASFSIIGISLNIITSPNYEAKNSYSVKVRAIDQGGLYFDKNFTINITNVNEAPTDIQISSNSIQEGNEANAEVGVFSATDPDNGNTFSYSLADGGTDNASFAIIGNALKLIPIANYDEKNSYTIKVKVTDQGGLTYEKNFTVLITEKVTTNLFERSSNVDVQIFPNPTKDFINVKVEGSALVSIHTLSGEVVQEWQHEDKMVPLNNIPSGLYLIKVVKDNSYETFKLRIE